MNTETIILIITTVSSLIIGFWKIFSRTILENQINLEFQGRKDEIDMNVTLKDLINRLNINEKFLKEHPENKELLERKNAEIKELIIQCILQNKDNSLLNDIVLK